MQLLITHGTMARTRVLHLGRWQLVGALAALLLVLTLGAAAAYHLLFVKGAREGWPVVAPLVRLVIDDERVQRERYVRDNLDAMAQRVGEFEARLLRLQAVSERISGLAGVSPDELLPADEAQGGAGLLDAPLASPAPSTPPGADPERGPTAPLGGAAAPSRAPAAAPDARGGPYVPVASPSMDWLQGRLTALEEQAELQVDLLTLAESRLMSARLQSLLMPSSMPVDAPMGSGFGFRLDPFTGRRALHTGLDFPADNGTPIMAAAGGVVVTREYHPAYGRMIEVDHGNGLVTRYAHASSFDVPLGAVVRRGQVIARVGSSGRSTGPHLHFEVLVDGRPQNPARFLAGSGADDRPPAFATPPRWAGR